MLRNQVLVSVSRTLAANHGGDRISMRLVAARPSRTAPTNAA